MSSGLHQRVRLCLYDLWQPGRPAHVQHNTLHCPLDAFPQPLPTEGRVGGYGAVMLAEFGDAV